MTKKEYEDADRIEKENEVIKAQYVQENLEALRAKLVADLDEYKDIPGQRLADYIESVRKVAITEPRITRMTFRN